jgi:hypothetical protein
MIFTSRSRVGLGVGLLVAGLLLIDAGNGRLIPVLASLAAMVLGATLIVNPNRRRSTTDKPDDPFASPPDAST